MPNMAKIKDAASIVGTILMVMLFRLLARLRRVGPAGQPDPSTTPAQIPPGGEKAPEYLPVAER